VGQRLIDPGGFRELKNFPILPVFCDNNFLASSKKHFDRVIDAVKTLPWVDFNQGLDARFLTKYRARRLAECRALKARVAWDRPEDEVVVMRAIDRLLKAGIPKGRIYCFVLIGFRDSPEEALYRFETLKKLGVSPTPMRYRPLDCLRKRFVDPETSWTQREISRFESYWSTRCIYNFPFEDYKTETKRKPRSLI
jgi:hypothetical protein